MLWCLWSFVKTVEENSLIKAWIRFWVAWWGALLFCPRWTKIPTELMVPWAGGVIFSGGVTLVSCLRPVNKPTPMLVQTTGAKLSSRSQTSKQAKTGVEIRGGTVGKEKKKKEGRRRKQVRGWWGTMTQTSLSYLCKKLLKNKSPAKSGWHRFPVWLLSFCSWHLISFCLVRNSLFLMRPSIPTCPRHIGFKSLLVLAWVELEPSLACIVWYRTVRMPITLNKVH